MNFENGKDFDKNMNQLLHLLKKIIKGLPSGTMPQGPFGKEKDKESGVNINFCFFNFLPITEADLEEMDELLDQFAPEDDREHGRDIQPELSASDLDFLRRNGIRF